MGCTEAVVLELPGKCPGKVVSAVLGKKDQHRA